MWKKCGRTRQVTDGNIIRSIRIACWITEVTISHSEYVGTVVTQWLRRCATNQKVAGSIPACVIDIKSFQSHYIPGVDSASNRNEYQEG